MAFDFASLFTPERMAQGQQGVQAINQMPWVWNQYVPQAAPMASAAAPVAPAASQFTQQQTDALSNLQRLFGITVPANQAPDYLRNLMAPGEQYVNYGD